MREFQDTTTTVLASMLPGLKEDARALFHHNKEEAMRLFRLAKRIMYEIHFRRFHFPQIAHQFN